MNLKGRSFLQDAADTGILATAPKIVRWKSSAYTIGYGALQILRA